MVSITGLALVILPWPTLMLLIAYPNPQIITLDGTINVTTTNSQSLYCGIILTAWGPISAFNPMTAKVTVNTRSDLLNFSKVHVIFWNALFFPYNSTYYPFATGAIYLQSTMLNQWIGSAQITYPTGGQFDVSVFLENTTIVIRRLDFSKVITIGSGELTFSYVSSLVFVSLEIIIIGLMILEFRANPRGYTEKRYSKTDP